MASHEPRLATADHPETPLCRRCGYDLSGLQIDANCSECGKPVWTIPDDQDPHGEDASNAMVWGMLSFALLACIGPFAGCLAIPAIIKGGRLRKMAKSGHLCKYAARDAKIGYTIGWITVSLSIALTLVIASRVVFRW